MKSNFFKKIILEQLYLTADLKEQPVQISDDFVILNGKVAREMQYNESKNILIYLDVSFYNKILNVVNANSDKKYLQFYTTIVENYFQVDSKWYCSQGNVKSKNKTLF
jgi:hypothetical protein